MPPRRPRFPVYFDRDDELQEYALVAAEYPNASPASVRRFVCERWDEHSSCKKRTSIPPEQLRDNLDWDSICDSTGSEKEAIMGSDVARAVDQCCQMFPEPIVRAAIGEASVREVSILLRMRKQEAGRQIDAAREMLRDLLNAYDYPERG